MPAGHGQAAAAVGESCSWRRLPGRRPAGGGGPSGGGVPWPPHPATEPCVLRGTARRRGDPAVRAEPLPAAGYTRRTTAPPSAPPTPLPLPAGAPDDLAFLLVPRCVRQLPPPAVPRGTRRSDQQVDALTTANHPTSALRQCPSGDGNRTGRHVHHHWRPRPTATPPATAGQDPQPVAGPPGPTRDLTGEVPAHAPRRRTSPPLPARSPGRKESGQVAGVTAARCHPSDSAARSTWNVGRAERRDRGRRSGWPVRPTSPTCLPVSPPPPGRAAPASEDLHHLATSSHPGRAPGSPLLPPCSTWNASNLHHALATPPRQQGRLAPSTRRSGSPSAAGHRPAAPLRRSPRPSSRPTSNARPSTHRPCAGTAPTPSPPTSRLGWAIARPGPPGRHGPSPQAARQLPLPGPQRRPADVHHRRPRPAGQGQRTRRLDRATHHRPTGSPLPPADRRPTERRATPHRPTISP